MKSDTKALLAGLALGGGFLYWLTREQLEAGKSPSSKPEAPRGPTRLKGATSSANPAASSAPRRRRPRRKLGERITRSTVDGSGHVRPGPLKLLAQARAFDSALSLDELAGARLIVSELGRGTDAEWAAIVDTELNRAKASGRSLAESLMGRSGRFGRQGSGGRPAATSQDPRFAHLMASIDIVRYGKRRGISRGARRFFDARVQDLMHRKWKAKKTSRVHSCSALGILEAWSFDYRRGRDADGKRRRRCPPDKSRVGHNTLAWVGPIEGVDAYELMLMAPMSVGADHLRRYHAARSLLDER